MSKISKRSLLLFSTIVILMISTGFLVTQNITIEQANRELQKTNQDLNDTNLALSDQIENLSTQLESINKSYSLLESYFGPNPDPLIATRLGVKIIDRPQDDSNYLWITGEVENTENVTVYNTRLNFTLYTNPKTESHTINLGTLTPHQIIEIRTSVQSSSFKILNWSLEATANYLP